MTAFGRDGYALRVAGEGVAVRTVASGREPGRAAYRDYSFQAAPGRIGLQGSRIRYEGDQGTSDPSAGVTIAYHRSRLLVGSTPDALAPMARCDGAGTSFPYAVGESFVAFVDECPSTELDDTGSRHLRYLDFSDGTLRRRSVTLDSGRFLTDEYHDRLRVAGRWAAVDASVPDTKPPSSAGNNPTVVIDLAAGREAYRVARYRAPYPGPSLESDGAAVDVDGTLVTVSGATQECAGTLAFHTPAEPAPQALPGRACAPPVEVDDGAFLYHGLAEGRRALMLGNVDGGAPRPVALGDDPGVIRAFDIEDGRAVYGVATCGQATSIRLVSLDSQTTDPAPRSRCPVRVTSRRAQISRRGRVTLPLDCPLGCDVSAALSLRVPPTGQRGRARISTHSSTVSPGPSTTISFQFDRRQRTRFSGPVTSGRLRLSSDKIGFQGATTTFTTLRVRLPRSMR